MIASDDDDAEPRLRSVQCYYFVDDDDAPVSFDVLPFQFDTAEEVPSFKKDVYLRGLADGGLQNVYKQVVAWKLGLDGESPEITVLCTEGSWIALLKPRPSYEETVRSVLVTVEMLHFVRRSPTASEENIWGYLRGVFDKYEVKPSEDDVKDHVQLIKLFSERDPAIAKSQTLQLFIKDYSMEKINEDGSGDLDIKQPFVADDKKREEVVEDEIKHEPCNDDDEGDEDDGDLFDSVCAICDNGGELLCCEGSCMRSFHAKLGDGEDSYCATLGYTKAEVKAIKNFLCKNCEYKQHQCFVCGELEPSDGKNAKVFLCNNATCGHFFHPKCVAQLLHPNNRNDALELEKNIRAGISFTCPVHWCFQCKGLEDRTQEPLQFAVCRRCPRSYHRKCLPREISFEDIDAEGIITRAWELSKRILIYCLDHDMDLDVGTPSRDHLKFPRISKPVDSVKKKVKELAEKKRTSSDLYVDEPMQKSSRRVGMKGSFEKPGFEPEKKKAKCLKEEPAVKRAAPVSSPKQHVKEEEQELESLSSLATGKIPQSSFPVIDSDTEKRVLALVEKKEVCSLTLEDISRRCTIPSTYTSSGRQIEKIIARGKLERSIQAVQAALQKLEHGGTIDDAKAVCEAEVLRQLTRWNNKMKVYLAPFIHGTRYTSFGRHFTKKEKLNEHGDVTVTSEERVLDAILTWCMRSCGTFYWTSVDELLRTKTPEQLFGERLSAINILLPFVRFPLMQLSVLKRMEVSNLVKHIQAFRHLVAEAIELSHAGQWMATSYECERFQHRRSSYKELQYISDGDSNGVIYYAGTSFGRHQWMNPVLAKNITVVASSPNSRHTDPKALVSKNYQGTCFTGPCIEDGKKLCWWMVDIGQDHQLMCNYYTVRQDGSTTFMRSWALQGSLDGQNWTSLRVHDDDSTICHPGQFASWPIVGPPALLPFRFFRVALTGPAAGSVSNTWNLCICFLELYGYFR